MVGGPAYIVRHVSALDGNPKLKLLVQKASDLLLANQFVTGGVPGMKRQVQGSSQIVKHSGLFE